MKTDWEAWLNSILNKTSRNYQMNSARGKVLTRLFVYQGEALNVPSALKAN